MRRLGALLAVVFVKLRLVVLLGWIAAVVWVLVSLPALESNSSGSLRELLPGNTPAVRAEQISIRRFSFPLLSRTIVVVRNPRGLPAQRQASLVRLASQLSDHQLPAYSQIKGALPLSDRVGGPSFARHPGTTMLIYLFFPPSVSTSVSTQVAQRLVRHEIGHRSGEYEGVTGEVPATVAEQNLINSRLVWVGLATILLAALAVGVRFRAVPAALLTSVAVVAAYLVADRVVARLARVSGTTVPAQAQPVLIVLVFGVTTDYAVFYLSRFRALLRDGVPRQSASVQVVREITPIVFTAGITVAAAAAAPPGRNLGVRPGLRAGAGGRGAGGDARGDHLGPCCARGCGAVDVLARDRGAEEDGRRRRGPVARSAVARPRGRGVARRSPPSDRGGAGAGDHRRRLVGLTAHGGLQRSDPRPSSRL